MEERLRASDSPRSATLADPALRTALSAFLRKRIPDADVDDVVQATLTEALAAERGPEDPTEIRKWAFGIARNKLVDLYRGRKRELPRDFTEEDAAAASGPESARELLRWAEAQLPEGADQTLEWMLREGDGEKLEHIAREENVPGTRVRQRITRLRKHFRERWALQVAAVLGVGGLLVLGVLMLVKGGEPVHAVKLLTPEEIVRGERQQALLNCERRNYAPCIEGLDRAKKMDPVGDTAQEIQEARRVAEAALAHPPAPLPSGTPIDSLPSAEPAPPDPPKERPATSATPPAPKPPIGKRGSSITPSLDSTSAPPVYPVKPHAKQPVRQSSDSMVK